MTSRSLRELYLEWLYEQIDFQGPYHYAMVRQLHAKEFVWIIDGDDQRAADAETLRIEFVSYIGDSGIRVDDPARLELPGHTFLEVLIGLSRRAAFIGDGSAEKWALTMLINAGLDRFVDSGNGLHQYEVSMVEEILDRIIWRTYHKDGTGGMFPLSKPREDQTKVEMWYQMNAYIESFPRL